MVGSSDSRMHAYRIVQPSELSKVTQVQPQLFFLCVIIFISPADKEKLYIEFET